MIIFCLVASVYHLTGVFFKINSSPVYRHLIFVFINLIGVYGFSKRPKYFIYFYCLLIIQQYYSHGQFLLKIWHSYHHVNWISLIVLILLPVGLIAMIDDCRLKKIKTTHLKRRKHYICSHKKIDGEVAQLVRAHDS